MPEGGFTTDGEVLIEAGQKVAALADTARRHAERLAAETDLPAGAFGNLALPPALNFTGRLAQVLSGPYADLRHSMTTVVDRTAEALEANGAALTAAGRHYLAEDEEWLSVFDAEIGNLRDHPATADRPNEPIGREPDRPTTQDLDEVDR